MRTETSQSFALKPAGPFSLRASIRFLEGFAPAGMDERVSDRLALALCLEGSWAPMALEAWQDGDQIVGRYVGDAAPEMVAGNVARILSVDIDGGDFAAVGQRDAIVGELQQRYPGLRPVGFWSPYEAAVWTILSQRVRIVQAAALKERIAAQFGSTFDIGGQQLTAFPGPDGLASLEGIASVPDIKIERLHGIAAAAKSGLLDSRRLRSMSAEAASADLQQLPGVGPFSAELILVRGAMAPDVFPTAERRLHHSMRSAYGVPDASVEELAQIAEGWRPYRSWVSVLFRIAREDDTHEIVGGNRH